jgi:glyoxylase-like metal-dependent hydrolase (beta-lactamase superfamily II)
MAELNIVTLEVGALSTCCYLIHREGKSECAVIDPGGDGDMIAAEIAERKLELKYIIATHSHFDHVAGIEELHKKLPDAKIVCHKTCGQRMQSPQHNMGFMIGTTVRPPAPDLEVIEGDSIEFDGVKLECLFVPGHAPGHMVFYSKEDNALFGGDVLFNGSMGRTDFEGCSFEDLIKGIKEKLLTLPAETKVYPGHGPSTSIGKEKTSNPFIQGT